MHVISGLFKFHSFLTMPIEDKSWETPVDLVDRGVASLSDEKARQEIARRVRKAREMLGLTQGQLAAATDGSRPGIQGIEAGKNIPGGKFLAGLGALGININWVLLGEGPELIEQISESTSSLSGIRQDVFTMAVELVDREAPRFGDKATSEARAEAYLLIYEMLIQDAEPDNKREAELVTKGAMAGLLRKG